MNKRPRRKLLINPGFQLRFAFYVCSWQLGLTLVYPLVISSLFDAFVQYLALDPSGPELSHLEDVRTQVVWILIGIQAAFIGATAFISIFLSHKIAGPLFKLNRTFLESSSGITPPKMTFRSKDYFQELATGFNRMWDAIRSRRNQDQTRIEAAIAHLEASKTQDPELRVHLESALSILKGMKNG